MPQPKTANTKAAPTTERRIVEDGEIFLDRTADRSRRQTRSALDAVSVTCVGPGQTGINGKALAADEPGWGLAWELTAQNGGPAN